MLSPELNHAAGVRERTLLQQHVTDLLLRFFQHLQAGPAGPWLDLNLTMPQLKMLFVVDWLGPAPMSHVAGRLHISVSTATGLIDRLVESGLARREHDVRDRRVVQVASTAAGRDLLWRLRSAGSERLEHILDHLSNEELQHCAGAVELVNQAADVESQSGQPDTGDGKTRTGAEARG